MWCQSQGVVVCLAYLFQGDGFRADYGWVGELQLPLCTCTSFCTCQGINNTATRLWSTYMYTCTCEKILASLILIVRTCMDNCSWRFLVLYSPLHLLGTVMRSTYCSQPISLLFSFGLLLLRHQQTCLHWAVCICYSVKLFSGFWEQAFNASSLIWGSSVNVAPMHS